MKQIKKNIKLIFFIIIIVLLSLNMNELSVSASNNAQIDDLNDLANLNIEMDSNGNPYITQFNENKNIQENSWTTLFEKYKEVLMGTSGIFTLTFVLMFMLNIAKLGNSAGKPEDRKKCIIGLLWTGIATAGFATITILMGMAFKSLQ